MYSVSEISSKYDDAIGSCNKTQTCVQTNDKEGKRRESIRLLKRVAVRPESSRTSVTQKTMNELQYARSTPRSCEQRGKDPKAGWVYVHQIF